MKMNRFFHTFIAVFVVMISLSARAEKWTIAVTEWYPYICEFCDGQGPAISSVRKMMNDVGIDIRFVFLPWARAISEVKLNKIDGFYPAWKEDLVKGMVLSDPVFRSPVGFVERKRRPMKWRNIEDLRGKTIGVVIDYGNTAEFNNMVKKGLIKTEEVKDDETNIRKVMGGRLDGAFIDVVNGRYLISKVGSQAERTLQINQKILAVKGVHIVFSGAAKMKADLFNTLLKKSRIQKTIDDYLKEHPPTSGIKSALL
jgi:polar amino acid transport system substrate-binding protein